MFPEKNSDPITPWQTTVSNLVAKETMDSVTMGTDPLSMPGVQPITGQDSQPIEIDDTEPASNNSVSMETGTGTVMDHSDLVPLPGSHDSQPNNKVSIATIDLSDDVSDDITPLDDVTEASAEDVTPKEPQSDDAPSKKKSEAGKEGSTNKGEFFLFFPVDDRFSSHLFDHVRCRKYSLQVEFPRRDICRLTMFDFSKIALGSICFSVGSEQCSDWGG